MLGGAAPRRESVRAGRSTQAAESPVEPLPGSGVFPAGARDGERDRRRGPASGRRILGPPWQTPVSLLPVAFVQQQALSGLHRVPELTFC